MRTIKTGLVSILAIGLLAGSVGVAAQGGPVEVTGQVTFRAPSFVETWATDDPRLTGDGTFDPTFSMDGIPSYWLMSRFLETDEGTWRQLPVPMADIAGEETDPYFDLVMVGEDGYEGLVFIAQAAWNPPSCPPGCDGFDVHGYIVEIAAP